ncbi:hypothetical protein BDQ12DRAFT_719518 [Crucibulum laeve]|uniref:Methyltransferase-domain-containing protein n=1 Tax=Crucibulum laeve TaxID=68775 RepID=A0A5C3MDF3_9AGAR|nr:hypothetical protein BDQ12DRAFT_719518 [Crucibulum laeve]
MASLPAHQTKHIPVLSHPFGSHTFSLTQLNNGVSNGTALWLGGQCLSMYLADVHNKFKSKFQSPPRAIELGSGIGLTALALHSLDWDVVATDLPGVVNSVLSSNIRNNPLPHVAGTIQIRTFDWTIPPDQWSWNNDVAIAPAPPADATSGGDTLGPPFDLIFSADTVYSVSLIDPLLRTCHHLSTLSAAASPSSRMPTVLLCIERRDPMLVDRLLAEAKDKWNFNVERIPRKHVVRAVEKRQTAWDKSEWEDVEIWKLKLSI